MGFLFSLLGTKLGRYAAIAAGIVFLIGLAWGALKLHDYNIRKEARAKAIIEFNQKQMEIVIKQQQEFIAQGKRLEALAQQTIEKLDETNKDLKQRIEDAEAFLNSPEAAQGDRGSSTILKETIRRLGKQK